MTVGEMLRRLDSSELTEWMAYFSLEAEPKVQDAKAFRASFQHLIQKKER